MKNTKLEEIAKRHGAFDFDWISETCVEVAFRDASDRARAMREMKDWPWYLNSQVDPDSDRTKAWVYLR